LLICKPASRWIRSRPPAPADPARDAALEGLYRRRASVERSFDRLKHEWALTPLRVRRLERVQLHADLTILSQLAETLNRGRNQAVLPA
jgi:hypothetical protein